MRTPRRAAGALAALVLGATACGPGPTGGDASGPTTCRSDRDCSARGLVCDRAQATCVECVSNTDCPGSGRACLRNTCTEVVSCTTSRTCPGQVCDPARGYCVDCVGDVDCTEAQVCQEGGCVARPLPCRSSRECSAMNQVCDTARGQCADCASDTDCASGEACSPAGRCLRATGPMPDVVAPPADAPPGEDAAPGCEAPRVLCGGSCVNRQTDPAHCGACGVACAAGQGCAGGTCLREDPCAAAARMRTGLGCEFWATTMASSQLDPGFTFAVVLANPQPTDVDVTVSGGALTAPRTQRIPALGSASISLPSVVSLAQNAGGPTATSSPPAVSARVADGAYRIVAGAPVSAWQYNPLGNRIGTDRFSYTNDASLLLPSHGLAARYVVSTRAAWQPTDALGANQGTPLGGYVTLIGTDPGGTEVTVRLTAPIVAGTGVLASAGATPTTFRLQQGEVLQLVSNTATADLTGTVVEANHPLAAFAGHDCATVPNGRPACDHLEEQLLPVASWGRRHIVSQLVDRAASQTYRVRILAQTAGTTLGFEGLAAPPECAGPLGANAFCEFETASNFAVTSTELVQVMQYMVGSGALTSVCMSTTPPPDRDECRGDPSMLTEVATERFRASHDVVVPAEFSRNVLNVTVPDGASATLDGVPLAGASTGVLGGHRVFFATVAPGRHRVQAVPATARIGVKLYGSAPYASYGTAGGLDF